MKGFARILFGYVTVAAGICGLLFLVAHGFRPDVTSPPPPPSPEVLSAVEASRDVTLDRDHPPVVVRDVNYADGASATWWPKQESPIFAELVQQGKLPPLAERIGPEPLVLEGCDGLGRYGGTWYRLANSERDVLTTQSLLTTPTLMRWSPHGYPIVPYIAKSLEVSPDQREFTFTLRGGPRFHDGTKLTAEDVAFSLMLLKEKGHPNISQVITEMAKAEAGDERTVVVTLSGKQNRAAESPTDALRSVREFLQRVLAERRRIDEKFVETVRVSGAVLHGRMHDKPPDLAGSE